MSDINALAAEVREAQRRAQVLHESRMAAFDEMCAATKKHLLLKQECIRADEERANAHYRLEQVVKAEAFRAVDEALATHGKGKA